MAVHKPPLCQVFTSFMLPVSVLSCPGSSVLLGDSCVEMSLVFLLLSILIKAPTLQGALSQEAVPELGFYFDHSI